MATYIVEKPICHVCKHKEAFALDEEWNWSNIWLSIRYQCQFNATDSLCNLILQSSILVESKWLCTVLLVCMIVFTVLQIYWYQQF